MDASGFVTPSRPARHDISPRARWEMNVSPAGHGANSPTSAVQPQSSLAGGGMAILRARGISFRARRLFYAF
jgi:hypothetical protein